MAEYDNKSTGALFKNDKGDNPKRPDYTGSYTDENGKEFKVNAWVKTDKNGKSFMSFNTQAKEPAHTQKQEYSAPIDNGKEDDKLPF
jgi:hypothetical protein